jgi:hypothetical protein
MATDRTPENPADMPPKPVDAHAVPGMGWVMPVWLVAFLVVVVFGIISYLFGWWYQSKLNKEGGADSRKSALAVPHSPTSQTRIFS